MVPYGETHFSYKIHSSCYLPSIDKYDLCHYYAPSINGVYFWFSERKKFLMVHIVQGSTTFYTPFPNWLWTHQKFEEGNLVHTKYVNTVIAEVKIEGARMN